MAGLAALRAGAGLATIACSGARFGHAGVDGRSVAGVLERAGAVDSSQTGVSDRPGTGDGEMGRSPGSGRRPER